MPIAKGKKQVTTRSHNDRPQVTPPQVVASPRLGVIGKLRTVAGASAYTGIGAHLLDQLAKSGKGPRRVQVSESTWRYHIDDLDRWMASLEPVESSPST